MCDLLGYSMEEFMSLSVREFHADLDNLNEIFDKVHRKEILRDFPLRLLHKDGSIRYVLLDSSANFDDAG